MAISMDGRGRAIDNVFVERLWRSVKYEEVYLKDYVDGWQAEASLAAYFRFYNQERIHQALGYRTPWEAYTAGRRLRRAKRKLFGAKKFWPAARLSRNINTHPIRERSPASARDL